MSCKKLYSLFLWIQNVYELFANFGGGSGCEEAEEKEKARSTLGIFSLFEWRDLNGTIVIATLLCSVIGISWWIALSRRIWVKPITDYFGR